MKNKKRNTNEHLQFPSGRTIKRCKEDAKALRKSTQNTDNYLSYNKALDVIAAENGMAMSWDRAVNKLIEAQSQEYKSETFYEFNRLVGRYRNEQSSYKKEVISRFGVNGKIFLPDGEGGIIELFQHRNSKSGLLVSEQVAKLVEADIEKMGGLRSLKGYDDGNIQILYEKPNSTSHLAYEIHINQDGVIHYFCRCIPWEGYEAELHARGFSVTHVGLGTRAIESGLHMKGFAFWHEYMTPKAL